MTDLVAERLADGGAQPAANAEWAELRPIIREGIAGLSEKHQAVVILYYLEGRSLQETADALGLPLGTVKSRLHHALRDLRVASTPTAGSAAPGARPGSRQPKRRGRVSARGRARRRLPAPPPGARGPRRSGRARPGTGRRARPPDDLRCRERDLTELALTVAALRARRPRAARAPCPRRPARPRPCRRVAGRGPAGVAPAGRPHHRRGHRRAAGRARRACRPDRASTLRPADPPAPAWQAAERATSPPSPDIASIVRGVGLPCRPRYPGRPPAALEGGALDRRQPRASSADLRTPGPSGRPGPCRGFDTRSSGKRSSPERSPVAAERARLCASLPVRHVRAPTRASAGNCGHRPAGSSQPQTPRNLEEP